MKPMLEDLFLGPLASPSFQTRDFAGKTADGVCEWSSLV